MKNHYTTFIITQKLKLIFLIFIIFFVIKELIRSFEKGIGLIDDIPTCKELIDRMIKEAYQSLQNLNSIFINSKL